MDFVRKAVIPAAGLGTRFLPATKALPKEMLPLVDKPVVQYAVEEAMGAGIQDLVFVTGRGRTAIEDHFDRSHELETVLAERGRQQLVSLVQQISGMCRFAYTRQRRPNGLGDALLAAETALGQEPFALFLADDVIMSRRPAIQQLVDLHAQSGATVIAVQRVPDQLISRYGIVGVRSSEGRVHEVTELVEKPAPGRAPSNLAIVGRYVLPPRIFDHLGRVVPASGGELQLTDALRPLAREETVLALEIEGRRFDCGSRLGYVQAIVELALARDDIGGELRSWLSELLE